MPTLFHAIQTIHSCCATYIATYNTVGSFHMISSTAAATCNGTYPAAIRTGARTLRGKRHINTSGGVAWREQNVSGHRQIRRCIVRYDDACPASAVCSARTYRRAHGALNLHRIYSRTTPNHRVRCRVRLPLPHRALSDAVAIGHGTPFFAPSFANYNVAGRACSSGAGANRRNNISVSIFYQTATAARPEAAATLLFAAAPDYTAPATQSLPATSTAPTASHSCAFAAKEASHAYLACRTPHCLHLTGCHGVAVRTPLDGSRFAPALPSAITGLLPTAAACRGTVRTCLYDKPCALRSTYAHLHSAFARRDITTYLHLRAPRFITVSAQAPYPAPCLFRCLQSSFTTYKQFGRVCAAVPGWAGLDRASPQQSAQDDLSVLFTPTFNRDDAALRDAVTYGRCRCLRTAAFLLALSTDGFSAHLPPPTAASTRLPHRSHLPLHTHLALPYTYRTQTLALVGCPYLRGGKTATNRLVGHGSLRIS